MERDAALQTGSVDASVTDYMGAMLLHSKGLKVSLPIACQGGFRLVFGRNKELDEIADLRGKHIGLSSNTLIDYATERALVDAKGKPLPYTRVEVQKIPIRLEMLSSGELDAAILPEPFATIGASKGLVTIAVPNGLTVGSHGASLPRQGTREEVSRSEGLRRGIQQGCRLYGPAPTKGLVCRRRAAPRCVQGPCLTDPSPHLY